MDVLLEVIHTFALKALKKLGGDKSKTYFLYP